MAPTLRCGFARADITPPLGTPMSCYPKLRTDLPWTPDAIKGYVGRQGVSDGIHDPLQVAALAIEYDGRHAVLIGVDTGMISLDFTNLVRDALAEQGVAPDGVLIGASHTHSGPDLFAWWEGDPDRAPAAQTLATTIETATAALARLEPAILLWGSTAVNGISINRRDEVEGSVDSTVAVLAARSQRHGEMLGLLANFACHPVTLDYRNLRFSADYVWALRETVAAIYPDAVSVFLNGCAGNLNPARFPYEQQANIYIPQTKENYPVYWGGFEDTRRMGRILGSAVVQAVERAVPLDFDRIGATRRSVELPLKQGADLRAFLDFMNLRLPSYRDRLQARTMLPTEVQRIQLGELTIIGLPGEPFVELGLAIKQAAHGVPVLIAGYANDDVRYVLTDDAYDGGQYETVGTPLAVGSAPRLVKAASEMLRDRR